MKRKNREGSARKGRQTNIGKKLIITAIILLLFSSVFFLKNLLRNLDYFNVKDVVVDSEGSGDFSYLKGKNIFELNVIEEADNINHAYPGFRKVKVIRVLPNRLFIDFVKRRPIAILKLYRLFSVDEDLVLFETGNESQMADLPIISGLETKIFGPRSGVRYNIKELAQVREIIRYLHNNRALRQLKIKSIKVHNSNITCLADAGSKSTNPLSLKTEDIEIRFGIEALQDKLDILNGLFAQIQNDLEKISYIDLRFKEPVIKFKDDKK